MDTKEIVISDLSKFGYREKEIAAKLLTAMCKGLPEDFDDDEVTVAMNTNSGYVFLTNSEYQVAMFNGDNLESFYSCPECGCEGFFNEIGIDNHSGEKSALKECKAWIKDVEANLRKN